MDQITHELRLADWQTIVTNCYARPAGQSKKQWLAEHQVPEKSFYYWQRKIRNLAYGDRQVEHQISTAYEFAEIPFRSAGVEAVPGDAPAAVIRKGNIVVELNNSVNDHLLERLLEVISHA